MTYFFKKEETVSYVTSVVEAFFLLNATVSLIPLGVFRRRIFVEY